jgi:hypothetical protein
MIEVAGGIIPGSRSRCARSIWPGPLVLIEIVRWGAAVVHVNRSAAPTGIPHADKA